MKASAMKKTKLASPLTHWLQDTANDGKETQCIVRVGISGDFNLLSQKISKTGARIDTVIASAGILTLSSVGKDALRDIAALPEVIAVRAPAVLSFET